MKTRIVPTVVLAVIALASLSACTGASAGSSSATSSAPPASALPTVDEPVKFVPGEFDYTMQGVEVTFSWKDDKGTLTVDNGSGGELGSPGMYAETHTQTRVPAAVKGAAPIPDGQTVSLEVTFPSSLKPDDVGMFALLFGDQNWGALSPEVAPSGSPSP